VISYHCFHVLFISKTS